MSNKHLSYSIVITVLLGIMIIIVILLFQSQNSLKADNIALTQNLTSSDKEACNYADVFLSQRELILKQHEALTYVSSFPVPALPEIYNESNIIYQHSLQLKAWCTQNDLLN